MTTASSTTVCGVCQTRPKHRRLIPTTALRNELVDFIHRRHAHADEICSRCLLVERTAYTLQRLEADRGTLSKLEAEIAEQAHSHVAIAANIDEEFQRTATFGDRAADKVASIGGSWRFVGTMTVLLLAWIAANVVAGATRGWDPYPFILLNLVLSCVAAFQAPILMMAQNRVSARDRRQADQDFRVNLKVEIEVASLHEKVDHLLHHQWEELVELQEIQIRLLEDLQNDPPAA